MRESGVWNHSSSTPRVSPSRSMSISHGYHFNNKLLHIKNSHFRLLSFSHLRAAFSTLLVLNFYFHIHTEINNCLRGFVLFFFQSSAKQQVCFSPSLMLYRDFSPTPERVSLPKLARFPTFHLSRTSCTFLQTALRKYEISFVIVSRGVFFYVLNISKCVIL